MALLQDLSEHLQIDDPEERQMVSRVSWEQYEALLADLGDNPAYHVTFLDGTLEIMSPSRRHEITAENIGRLLEAYLEETRTRFWGLGSTTFRRAATQGGTEPDKSYNLETEKAAPDLAIEVIVTSGGVDKLEIYKRLGAALSTWSSLCKELGGRDVLAVLIRRALRWLFLGTTWMLLISRQVHR